MGRQKWAAVGTAVGAGALARCSPSMPMERVLPTCIVSLAAVTEVIRGADWSYRATPCMGRRLVAAVRAMAQCSPSTPMARVLQRCIVLLAAATEPIRGPD